jgi:hypothetical protein
MPACGPIQATSSPELESPQPSPSSRRRAPSSACSPGKPTLSGPPLGRREANRATHCAAPSLSSPESEQPRTLSSVSVVPARRSNPYPPIRGQQTLGEWNRASGLFVCQPRSTSPPVSLPTPPRVPLWGFVDSRV